MNRYEGDGTGRGSIGLDDALDRSLALLDRGRTPEDCLDRFPEHAQDLQPLLEVAAQIRRVQMPTPAPTRGANGKQRMLEALAQKKAARGGLGARLREWLDTLFEGSAQPGIDVQRLLRSAAVAAAVIVLIAVGAVAIRSWRGMTVQQEAVLTSQAGLVEVLPAGADTWGPVSEPMLVQAGDRIRTGAEGSAQLTFFDGSITALRPEAELSIARMASRRSGGEKVIVLHQWLGEAYNQVQPLIDEDSRFSVETASAVVSVRGTAFTLTVEPDGGTRLEVHEGTIEVRTRETSVLVSGGEEIRVKPPQATATPPPTSEPTATPPPSTPLAPNDPPSILPPWTEQLTETPGPSELDALQPTEEIATPQPAVEESPPPPTQGDSEEPSEPEGPPEPSDETEEPPPPDHVPPGLTRTPQPPGLTKTPQPPGHDDASPEPPDPGDDDDDDDNDNDNDGGGRGPQGEGPPGKDR